MTKPPVLVVPAPANDSLRELLQRTDYRFVARAEAEVDHSLKQVIPYVIVSIAGRILAYRRSPSTGEQRLAERVSVGWGGHIEEVDLPNDGTGLSGFVAGCALRELGEELGLGEPDRRVPLGTVNDDTEDVGKVHVGVVEIWYYEDGPLLIEEGTASEVFWLAGPDHHMESMESWSVVALRLLRESSSAD